jgi:hypothetical protein
MAITTIDVSIDYEITIVVKVHVKEEEDNGHT